MRSVLAARNETEYGAANSCRCCFSDPATTPLVGTATPETAGVTCYCPLDGVLDPINKKYARRIVRILDAAGPTRYGELQDRLLGVSSATLGNQLYEFDDAELIERRSFDEVPPHVEYSLTLRGRELEIRLQPLLEWELRDEY